MADIVYQYKNQVYLNITNRCPCRCEFCIRSHGDSVGDAENLWFEREPELEEIFDAVDSFDFSGCREIIYCGGDGSRQDEANQPLPAGTVS